MKDIISFTILHVILILSYTNLAHAKNYVLLIGGGPSLEHSQSSIEQNVIWSKEIIKNINPEAQIRIFYSDGDNPAPDIINHLKITDQDANLLPFDRIFSKDVAVKEYYNHSIKSHSGSTTPEHMVPIIIDDFKSLTNDDSVLILYNGHGGYAPHDLSKNYLRLWGEKKLTVYDFESMLSTLRPDIPVRFIMTQCFSGGFTNAIHPGANKGTFELTGNRCGFMSQSARRESEGCTASLNVGDYRDYSTYFFAALDGKTRQNTPLLNNPDFNGDSQISLREAHLYTLASAYSSDLSRSTTEDILEKWEPWYLRWISAKKNQTKSIYYRLAIMAANNNNIALDVLNNPRELRKLRISLINKHEKLTEQEINLKKAIKAIQSSIQENLNQSFPKTRDSYKNKFSDYTEEQLDKTKNIVINMEGYGKLVQLFSEKSSIEESQIDANRKLVQAEKLFRLLKLSKLDALMPTFSDARNFTRYKKVLACENSGL